MRDLFEDHQRKRTQTEVSAFFCAFRQLALTTALILLGIVSAAAAQTAEAKKPVVHLKGISVERLDWSKRTADTKLSIVIENYGPAFKIKDLSYRLKLNDTLAGEGRYEQEISVPATSSAAFELPCTVDLSAAPGIAWGIIAGGFDVHYELDTEFTLPILPLLSPRIKTAVGGDISLASTVSGWTAKIKERLSNQ